MESRQLAPVELRDRQVVGRAGNLVDVQKLTKRFGGLVANRDVDFAIPYNAIVSLIGPNGAGKTTFFNQITGMYQPTSGSVVFDGTNIVGLSPHEIVERGIGRTFQNIRLFNDMSVLAN
ncbi:MAG: ATP-binding cassette domain-containing protein, partial [Chloroflexi bacterium]|nr:ATP-binding cassette domain-containing protein [Chloroflexota bacterium]